MRKIAGAIYLIYSLSVFFAVMFLLLPFFLIFTLLPSKISYPLLFSCIRLWSLITMTFIFIKIKTHKNPNWDKNKSYIYIGNHGSYLDAPAVILSTPSVFKPLGKIEMAKFPVFGWIYKKMVIMVDRKDKESRAASVAALKAELNAGMSILLFPEGTMNTTELMLKDFYDGAFKISIETQTPIAPMLLLNAKEMLPRKHPLMVSPGVLHVICADIISPENYTMDDVEAYKQAVFKEMNNQLIQLKSYDKIH
jgi:1-acyl-sn-glycerol-3-phosphate acyltransferase